MRLSGVRPSLFSSRTLSEIRPHSCAIAGRNWATHEGSVERATRPLGLDTYGACVRGRASSVVSSPRVGSGVNGPGSIVRRNIGGL